MACRHPLRLEHAPILRLAQSQQYPGASRFRFYNAHRHCHRVADHSLLALATMKTMPSTVLIIGAGPAGSVAAALLRQQGLPVLVIEREQFPRFSIGESLLPQSMHYLEEAGMLRVVIEAGFQFKNGAAFVHGDRYTDFDFRDKHSQGWGTTYQVERARFDHLLALEAERQGAEIRYRHEVVAVDIDSDPPRVTIKDSEGKTYAIKVGFILDASGFGRILSRLLQLESPSNFPVRGAIFTHIEDGILSSGFDRNKIRITVHPEQCDVWYWLIPFANRSEERRVGKECRSRW